MYARKRLDISPGQMLRALASCLIPGDHDRLEREATQAFRHEAVQACGEEAVQACGEDDALAALSVRSAFDALLKSSGWPRGSRVLMSAITTPHMVDIVRAHGFVPVAIDIDPRTLQIDCAHLRRTAQKGDAALVLAHLFGARHPLEEVLAITADLEIPIIEDAAQAWGASSWRGDERALASLFSFGSIKTSTAMGGAVMVLREAAWRSRAREVFADYPAQSEGAYAKKMLGMMQVQLLLHPRVLGRFVAVMGSLGKDYDDWFRQHSKGFARGELLGEIRRRPSRALLRTLRTRLLEDSSVAVAARRAAGDLVVAAVDSRVCILGGAAAGSTHWLFAVAAEDSGALVALIRKLRSEGFDATDGASTLVAVQSSESRAVKAESALAHVVYIPVSDLIPSQKLRRLAEILNETVGETSLESAVG
jgi:perosamine synthetase